jgi:hypothetical protein
MSNMERESVVSLDAARERGRRVSRAVDARRSLLARGDERRVSDRAEGRAWVNGSELGGPRTALAHLTECYD